MQSYTRPFLFFTKFAVILSTKAMICAGPLFPVVSLLKHTALAVSVPAVLVEYTDIAPTSGWNNNLRLNVGTRFIIKN